jgi:toxin ParE1/3/4
MKLRYTQRALEDLSAILDYIAGHSPVGARRVQARIRSAIDLLPQQPHIGVRTKDPAVRRLTVLPYSYIVLYEIVGEEIRILTVSHSSRGSHPL